MEVDVKMPRLGEEMIEGTIVEWLKKEGDQVTKDESLLVVDSGKAALEVEAEVSGTLKKILVPADTENIAIGQVIAIIESDN